MLSRSTPSAAWVNWIDKGLDSHVSLEIERGQKDGQSKYYLYDIGYHFLTSEKIKIFKRAKVD